LIKEGAWLVRKKDHRRGRSWKEGIKGWLTETLLRNPFSVIGRCSLVPASHWLQRKCARINLSQAASGMILQNHRRLSVSILRVKIVTSGFLKRVTGGKDFQN
jgi:hypothetical protein